MEMNQASPFMQGLESRLNSLFDDETEKKGRNVEVSSTDTVGQHHLNEITPESKSAQQQELVPEEPIFSHDNKSSDATTTDHGSVEKIDLEEAVQNCPDERLAKAEIGGTLLSTLSDEACRILPGSLRYDAGEEYHVTPQTDVFQQPQQPHLNETASEPTSAQRQEQIPEEPLSISINKLSDANTADHSYFEKLDLERAVQKCPDARRAKAEEEGVLLRTSNDKACSVTPQMGVFQQPQHHYLNEITPEPQFGQEQHKQIMDELISGAIKKERYNSIFEEIHNIKQHDATTISYPDLKDPGNSEAGNSVKAFDQYYGTDLSSKSILFSPIKELKSVLLSLEWEINDQLLDKLDREISILHDLYIGDTIALGFLRILRFLGRYIKIKQTDAHYQSIILLMSVYDDFEKIFLSGDMAEEEKQSLLVKSITKYRTWADDVDLESQVKEPIREKISPLAHENILPPQQWLTGIQDKETIGKPKSLPPERKDLDGKEDAAAIALSDTIPDEEIIRNISNTIANIKNMTPHEAFAYALEDIKMTISTELSAIRAEIRMWRQGQ